VSPAALSVVKSARKRLCLTIRAEYLIDGQRKRERDGFDLIRQVREAGYTAQQLPAVALTAFANKAHADSALLRGFQIHIRKPVDADDLITVVAGLAGRTV
jgi:CheY-like chemotaxis protein